MTTFLFTFSITFSILLLTAVLLSYCKRRQNRTNHGLTGMCHKSGGEMGSCCASRLLTKPDANNAK